MKKIIKIGVSVVAIGLIAGAGYGQGSEERVLDRQVDVSRDYIPEMGGATKLSLTPNMRDTVALRPAFDYSITPSAWRTGFGVAAINPVMIDASQYNPNYPFYLKLGAGVPLQSLLDFYAVSTGRKGAIGGYVNHYGRYSKIETDQGEKAKANRSNNRIGLFVRHDIGRRMGVDAQLGVDYDTWSRYGHGVPMDVSQIVDREVTKQHYVMPHAGFSIGNRFKDLSYFNFRAGAGFYLLKDKKEYNNNEIGTNIFAEIGKEFGVHGLRLRVDYDNISLSRDEFDGGGSRDKDDQALTIAPRYSVSTKRFNLSVGVNILYNNRTDLNSKLYLYPQLDMSLKLAKGWLVPYISLDSRRLNNGLRSLKDRNPYLDNGAMMPTWASLEHNLRGGVHGTISKVFSYRVYAGLDLNDDPVFFYKERAESAKLDFLQIDQMTAFTFGLELEGRISGSFSGGASLHTYSYSKKSGASDIFLEETINSPKFDAGLFLSYNHKDKFSIKAAATVIGKRTFLEGLQDPVTFEEIWNYPTQKASVNLGLEAEYFIKRGFGLFLSGDNLLNSKLYPFQNYPDFGISMLAGVKLVF